MRLQHDIPVTIVSKPHNEKSCGIRRRRKEDCNNNKSQKRDKGLPCHPTSRCPILAAEVFGLVRIVGHRSIYQKGRKSGPVPVASVACTLTHKENVLSKRCAGSFFLIKTQVLPTEYRNDTHRVIRNRKKEGF